SRINFDLYGLSNSSNNRDQQATNWACKMCRGLSGDGDQRVSLRDTARPVELSREKRYYIPWSMFYSEIAAGNLTIQHRKYVQSLASKVYDILGNVTASDTDVTAPMLLF